MTLKFTIYRREYPPVFYFLGTVEESRTSHVYSVFRYKDTPVRADFLSRWRTRGGVLILSYPMFRTLVNLKASPKAKEVHIKQIRSALLNPGRLMQIHNTRIKKFKSRET